MLFSYEKFSFYRFRSKKIYPVSNIIKCTAPAAGMKSQWSCVIMTMILICSLMFPEIVQTFFPLFILFEYRCSYGICNMSEGFKWICPVKRTQFYSETSRKGCFHCVKWYVIMWNGDNNLVLVITFDCFFRIVWGVQFNRMYSY